VVLSGESPVADSFADAQCRPQGFLRTGPPLRPCFMRPRAVEGSIGGLGRGGFVWVGELDHGLPPLWFISFKCVRQALSLPRHPNDIVCASPCRVEVPRGPGCGLYGRSCLSTSPAREGGAGAGEPRRPHCHGGDGGTCYYEHGRRRLYAEPRRLSPIPAWR
jgi:hypothetical protein